MELHLDWLTPFKNERLFLRADAYWIIVRAHSKIKQLKKNLKYIIIITRKVFSETIVC